MSAEEIENCRSFLLKEAKRHTRDAFLFGGGWLLILATNGYVICVGFVNDLIIQKVEGLFLAATTIIGASWTIKERMKARRACLKLYEMSK